MNAVTFCLIVVLAAVECVPSKRFILPIVGPFPDPDPNKLDIQSLYHMLCEYNQIVRDRGQDACERECAVEGNEIPSMCSALCPASVTDQDLEGC